MKPALVRQLFERLERFVDWNTFAARRFENQADRAGSISTTGFSLQARVGQSLWRMLRGRPRITEPEGPRNATETVS